MKESQVVEVSDDGVEKRMKSVCRSDSVWQAVNIWRSKVYSYGRLLCFAMCRSIMHAAVIRAQL